LNSFLQRILLGAVPDEIAVAYGPPLPEACSRMTGPRTHSITPQLVELNPLDVGIGKRAAVSVRCSFID